MTQADKILIIAERSQGLVDALHDGIDAIIGRGGTIALDAGFRDFPSAIYNIPADNAITTVVDNTSASVKTVPANSTKYAYLAELGGMTYRCNNLIPYPFSIYSYTASGITFAANADQSITVAGTATGNTSATVQSGISISAGKIYTISHASALVNDIGYIVATLKDDGAVVQTVALTTSTSKSFTAQSNGVLSIAIVVRANATLNETLTIMLNEGSSALPYEPYFAGLRDAKVTEIVSYGRNSLPTKYVSLDGRVSHGITYSINPDGSIHASGTSTGNSVFYFSNNSTADDRNKIKQGKYYIVSGGGDGVEIVANYYNTDGTQKTWLSTAGVLSKVAPTEFKSLVTYILIRAGVTVDEDIYPMLNAGQEALPYLQPREPISYTIPAEIQALDGYGAGLDNTYYNYIEWRDGRRYFVQNTKKIVFNGTEYWSRSSATGIMQASFALPKTGLHPYGISNLYDFVKYYSLDTLPEFRLDNASARLWVDTSLDDFADVDAWKSYLATRYANGNPVTVEYVLAEPIETQITTDSSPLINVEGGGTIEFVNEYGYAVPSKITYQTLTQ